MTKRNIILLTATIIGLLVMTLTVIYALNERKSSAPHVLNKNNTSYTKIRACDLLSLEDAKRILGVNAQLTLDVSQNSALNESTSECSYTNGETDLTKLKTVSVSARTALNKDGIDGNASAFESSAGSIPAAGDQVVEGYGEKALWDTATHRLSILKNNVWLRIISGGTDQTMNTLDDAKIVADIILKKKF